MPTVVLADESRVAPPEPSVGRVRERLGHLWRDHERVLAGREPPARLVARRRKPVFEGVVGHVHVTLDHKILSFACRRGSRTQVVVK